MTAAERDRLRAEIDLASRRRLRLPDPGQPQSRRRDRRCSDPAQRAGRRNVERMREAFARLGVATQAEAARAAEVRSGSSTWATRALLEEGAIAPTGRQRHGSREFAASCELSDPVAIVRVT